VPGLRPDTVTGAAGTFTAEVAATATETYMFTPSAGSYLYHSATDRVRTQVPMGMYGALVVDVSHDTVLGSGEAYPGVLYAQDEVLVYSAIDPNLNADPGTFDGAKVINWNPQYSLINGMASESIAIDTSTDVLLRFFNAGLDTVVPTLDGGLYMGLKAEDGNRYPQPFEQYGIELQAGKTIDAMVNAGADGTYALYDRAGHGGGISHLVATAAAGAPVAADDPGYTVAEGDSLIVAAPGVLGNDTGASLTASLVSDVSGGTLTLNPDGSFTYTPDADFNGTDIFTYIANDGALDSNVATATITVTGVNSTPVAMPDAYDAPEGGTLFVAAPGVLENDVDPDGDPLTATAVGTPPPGLLILIGDGSFDYAPAGLAGDIEQFDYEACDPSASCSTATVTITVVPPVPNIPPTAVDDYAATVKNSAGITINLTDNDTDVDGTINPATVVITTGGTTQRRGTVVNNLDGTVTYTPKRGFRGTDVFQYEVNDDVGATSNVATVRVNVQ
jgi:VCBS repeat-containing protein